MFINLLESQLMKISHGKHIYFILIRFQRRYQQACRVYKCTCKVCNNIQYKTRETMCVPSSYCALFWLLQLCVGIYRERIIRKLQLLQNRSARIVTLSNSETLSKDLLDELSWEVLEDRKMRQLTNSNVQNNSWNFHTVFKKIIKHSSALIT